MVSNVWRQRESSCLALSNLLQGLLAYYFIGADLLRPLGRKWEQVAEYLADMWVRCFRYILEYAKSFLKNNPLHSFRTMDDIKESVRKAGKVASQSLSNLSVRQQA